MPIYEFFCEKCGNEEEKIVSFSKKDEQFCSKCNETTKYVPSLKTGGVLGLPNGYAPTRSKVLHKREIGGADTK